MTRNPTRYSTVAIVLHWLIAAAIIFQIVLAWRMEDLKTPLGFALVQMHKSVGISILLLSLARLGWRLVNPPPPEPEGLTRWELWLSKFVHVALYGIMIGMPLTGWLMVSASKIQIPTLLFGVVPWPHLPVADLAPAAKAMWQSIGKNGHGLLAWGAYLLVGLHVAGALKHQLFDREMPLLARMAPGARPGKWLDLRLLVIGLSGVGVIALAGLFQPTLPASAPLPLPPVTDVAIAVAEPAATTGPSTAPAAEPVVGPSKWAVSRGSSLGFSTTWGGQDISGRFDRFTADILFGSQALDQSRVSVSIDLASAVTGDAQRDQSLPGPDWLDTATHPMATFVATRFEKVGDDRFIARGKLTLRGVTQAVNLPFRLKIDGDKATMSGVTTLDRTAFGVGQGEWQATDQIPASVKVSIKLTATRK